MLECKVFKVVEIGLHTGFIGEILDVKADMNALTDGALDIQRVKPLLFGTGDCGYHTVGAKIGAAFTQLRPPALRHK